MTDPFWVDDYKILYDRDHLASFVPQRSMTLAEKLNAMVRFCAYAGIALFAYNQSATYLYLPLIMMLVTKLVYDNQSSKETMISIVSTNQNTPITANPRVIKDGLECVPPTDDNPFMNVSMADYTNDPKRPPACSLQDPDIKESATAKFYDNLFRDVNDVYGRTNSARQFYAMPSTTIPNAQEEFIDFCYGDMKKPGCKQGNMTGCMNDDLRYNRRPPQLDINGQQYV